MINPINWLLFHLTIFLPKPVFLIATKILKFQENRDGNYTTSEWAQFKGSIPHLNNFTICHWEKLMFFSVRDSCPWAYCYKYGETFDDHHCTQMWYNRDLDSGGRYITLAGGFGDGTFRGKRFKSGTSTIFYMQMIIWN